MASPENTNRCTEKVPLADNASQSKTRTTPSADRYATSIFLASFPKKLPFNMKEFRDWIQEGNRQHPFDRANINRKIKEGETLDDCANSENFLPYFYGHLAFILSIHERMDMEKLESFLGAMDTTIALKMKDFGLDDLELDIDNALELRGNIKLKMQAFGGPDWWTRLVVEGYEGMIAG